MKNVEDKEKVSEMEVDVEMVLFSNRIMLVVLWLIEIESLVKVFDGCVGVFYIVVFVDLVGIFGYLVCFNIIYLMYRVYLCILLVFCLYVCVYIFIIWNVYDIYYVLI